MSTSGNPRHFTDPGKLRILDEAQQAGVQVAGFYRRRRIATSQFYGWRELARRAPSPSWPHGPSQEARAGSR